MYVLFFYYKIDHVKGQRPEKVGNNKAVKPAFQLFEVMEIIFRSVKK
jgi:hypothetical protein